MIGITWLQRKSKDVCQIAFSYKGIQCRETLTLERNKTTEKHCEGLRLEILRKIDEDKFVYTDYFPKSNRVRLFGMQPVGKKTLKEALESYLLRAKKTLEASSYSGYRKAIKNYLIPWCGHLRVVDLTPAEIRDWMSEQTVKLKTLRNRLLPLRNVLNEAVNDGVIAFNPLDRVDLAKQVSPAQRESDFEADPYTEAQVVKLLGNLADEERWVFQAWAYTGVRTGEQIGLRWPRVDFEAKIIRIEETTTERVDKSRPKTKSGRRAVPMLPAALEAFEAQRQHTLLAGGRVFQNPRGRAKDKNGRATDKQWDYQTLEAVWRRAHKDTKIAYRNPYQLRHTWASNLLSQGENIALISKLLGHKTIEVAMKTYAKYVEQGQQLGFDRPVKRYGMERLWSAAEERKTG